MKKQIITLGLIIGLTVTMQARTLEEAVAVCEAGNAQMCIGLGKDFQKRKNQVEADKYFSKGVGILETECNKSNADACFSLGQLYVRGSGVTESSVEAKKLYDKSASMFQNSCEKGDSESCMMVEQIKMHLEML